MNPSNSFGQGGSLSYYNSDGTIYKVRSDDKGDFPVKDSIVISAPTTLSLVGYLGITPISPVQTEIMYDGGSVGFSNVENEQNFTLN
ncbi:MAG: hypothetical protein JWN30_1053 [Bacilli bacterium]|nr:hypothetical protein [Bacilli bacterium]